MLDHFENETVFFMHVTPPNRGAVSVFHIYGIYRTIQEKLSESVLTGSKQDLLRNLSVSEIKYGRMYAGDGNLLDEVLVARPNEVLLVLMCHGGTTICQKIHNHLKNKKLIEMTDFPSTVDRLLDPLLAGCLTGTQVATMLQEQAACRKAGKPFVIANPLFVTHHICLAGPPNAGKSSLLNRLSGFDRAFVHEEAGATRDAVCEMVEMAGYAVLVEDLPGFPTGGTGIMREAWERAAVRISLSEIVVFVIDSSRGWDRETAAAAEAVATILADAGEDGEKKERVILALNKSDLPSRVAGQPWRKFFPDAETVSLCSLEGGDAAERLAAAFYRIMTRSCLDDWRPMRSEARHDIPGVDH